MIEQLTSKDFAELPPEALALEVDGQRVPLTVLELRELPPISPRQAPFALVVGGPGQFMLPQAVYPLLHPTHGRLDLFIVPIARDAAYTRYEIIFN